MYTHYMLIVCKGHPSVAKTVLIQLVSVLVKNFKHPSFSSYLSQFICFKSSE